MCSTGVGGLGWMKVECDSEWLRRGLNGYLHFWAMAAVVHCEEGDVGAVGGVVGAGFEVASWE